MKKPHRVSFQDSVAIGSGQVKLIQHSGRIFDVLGGEVISADHDAIGPDQAHQKLERLRIIDQVVVMKSAQVVAERVLDRGSPVIHVKKEMLNPSRQVGEGAACMRQNDLQVRIPVERAGVNEFTRQEGVFDGSVDPSGEVRRSDGPTASESIGHTIHLMKDDWVVQFLNAGKNGRKSRIEYIVVPFDGIRQVDSPHAGLSRDAVELLQGQLGVTNGQFDSDDESIGIFLVDLNAGVVDDLRKMRALLS